MKKKENIMQMRTSLFILSLILIFSPNNFVFAADSKKDKKEGMSFSRFDLTRWEAKSDSMSERYEDNIRNIRLGKAKLENKIFELRAYYPYTRYYEPFSKKLIDEMTLYAYTVDTSKDRAEVNKALNSFRVLVYKHLAHLGVVSYAVRLSRLDPRLGDEYFYMKVRDLIRGSWDNILAVGSTPDLAYKVITYAEEDYILQTYEGTLEKSDIYEVNKQFYDVRDIVTKEGDYIQLFFDVTMPIKTVNILKAIAERDAEAFIPIQ